MLAVTLLAPWTVTIPVGAVTNERAAGISGVNPVQLNPWYCYGVATIKDVGAGGPPLNGVRIYGAQDPNAFPAAGAAAEAIAVFGAPGGSGIGLIRQLRSPTIPAGAGGSFIPLSPIPQFLLLEYDVGAGGAGNTILTVVLHLWGFREVSIGE